MKRPFSSATKRLSHF